MVTPVMVHMTSLHFSVFEVTYNLSGISKLGGLWKTVTGSSFYEKAVALNNLENSPNL